MPNSSGQPPENDSGRILRFWHQVEFFLPFDLQQQVLDADDADWAVRGLSLAELQSSRLPLWRPIPPPDRRLTGFDVYLGVFDKCVLAQVTRSVVNEDLAPAEKFEEEERAELEGATCIAKIRVGLSGEPFLDDVSISTAPWALGRIQGGTWSALDFEAFQQGVEELKTGLKQFRAARQIPDNRPDLDLDSPDEDPAATGPAPLSGQDLFDLLAMFEDWAGFSASAIAQRNAMLVVVRALSVEKSARKQNGFSTTAAGAAEVNGRGGAGSETDEEDADTVAEGEDDIQVDILNSFFATDIARAINTVEQGGYCPTLKAYLNPLPPEKRLDLYQPEGRKHIQHMLAPTFMNQGHWPDEPAQGMSLMQQFAINSLLQNAEEGSLFSVNGPPGTGKTTLLRDVFAELVTRRARVLAGFGSARDAFNGTVPVEFNQGSDCRVSTLREELTGFEMVVASSNNAAVENISHDIPKAKALGRSAWRDTRGHARIGYLQSVAHNIAARKARGDYAKLKLDDAPWSLMACALGNARNRRSFAYRLTADGSTADIPPRGFDAKIHQSLWTWRKGYRGATFAEARRAFLKAEAAVAARVALLQRYATLQTRLGGKTQENFCAAVQASVAQARSALEAAQAELGTVSAELAGCEKQLALLREEARLIEQLIPPWWVRWFRRARHRQCQADLNTNRKNQLAWLERQRAAELRHQAAQDQLSKATAAERQVQTELATRQQEWQALHDEWKNLAVDFPQAACPESPEDLEQDCWQIRGLWRDEILNRLRSELFVAALGLHEAWLAEVLKNGGGFGGNLVAISQLLSGRRLRCPAHALAIWQSLFMIVPVVSSTFASIARQFRELGPHSLGWLFIDEAGQAVPQAAVGALWRAKHAVIVGDPLQIEPVFTVPIKLIEALARGCGLPARAGVEPHRVSVQNLADAGNALGAWIDGGDRPQWIGSPLRVHRRCVDPMFTVANTIAYQGKMIYFDPVQPIPRQPPSDSLDLGPSAWVRMGGKASNKQVVPQQIELVCQAVAALYERIGELPALYVISPFRRVKEALTRQLQDPRYWPARRPSKSALRSWCKTQVGTVHTFQGKEESLVLMVLGCDEQTRGAAAWAAGKPNLFNVALTRAKHRFFVIGDDTIWSELPYFSDAHEEHLPRIGPEEFLERVRDVEAWRKRP
ncbi:AAA domain-containing protein [uncultured Azohydromonas sp.]|jgi:Superfamily I DNA and RNA helicases and helicase subunits|uniref:DEAD/DEAH box helicase n=1 Tax=uncultured Azohydromonas sp. TaxID=487342 RepID=UPI00261C02AE|nr:AAA domain-containing protein [uncultured Azohydromonas sp.]